MKIEKISDNQIKCILDGDDLRDRKIRLAELAYCSEKAKALFSELIEQAANEFDFNAENIPIMIEAIPITSEKLVLLMTKVEDADELDTRLSVFTPFDAGTEADPVDIKADDILSSILEYVKESVSEEDRKKLEELERKVGISSEPVKKENKLPDLREIARNRVTECIFAFEDLNSLVNACVVVGNRFKGKSMLYHANGKYLLVLVNGDEEYKPFAVTCNIFAEQGTIFKINYATIKHLEEHFKPVVKKDAIGYLQKLA